MNILLKLNYFSFVFFIMSKFNNKNKNILIYMHGAYNLTT